jgi:leucyl-tRNA synthetase
MQTLDQLYDALRPFLGLVMTHEIRGNALLVVRSIMPDAVEVTSDRFKARGTDPISGQALSVEIGDVVTVGSVRIDVQVNGESRCDLDVDAEATKARILALAIVAAAEHLGEDQLDYAFYVPGVLVNIVTKRPRRAELN